MIIPLILALIAVISYALGSLNGALVASKALYRKDIRNYGSGNAGLTNTMRTFGRRAGAIVLVIDTMKGVIAAIIGGLLMGIFGYETVGQVFAGFCAIMGHCFPIYYGFKGGKGALAGFSMLLVADFRVAILVIIVFFVVIAFTRYVSLGSILSSMSAPILMLAFGYSGLEALIVLLGVIIIVFSHRENIVRLINHSESKASLDRERPEDKIKNHDF